MKKTISLILALLMLLSLAACGSGESTPPVTEAPAATDSPSENLSFGESLRRQFETLVTGGETELQTLADALLSNPAVEFAGASMPVEPGYLAGFTAEIAGFEQGVMFGPAIGSIPFVGYVFTAADSAAAESLQTSLLDSADPRWNICVEADETVSAVVDNLVFFVMCPKA